ncbi:MAG: DUF4249 domain-containing protein [Bacteroidales bacterium]|nr:DUF4249 domain-containing protein [Bacteroidales bacterium]
MAKRKNFVSLILLVCTLGFLSSACSGLIEDIDLSFAEPPIVVHCYLFPGMQVIEISVEYAHNIGGGAIPSNRIPVEDALVKLWSEIHEPILIPYDETKMLFSSSAEELTIIEGLEYYLLIEHHQHHSISAKVRIPESHNEFFVEVSELETKTDSRIFSFVAWVQDKPQEKNFYQFFGFLDGVRICEIEQGIEEVEFSYSIFDFNPLTPDENRDGLTILFTSRELEFFNSHICHYRIDSLRFSLAFFEESTFFYLKSIEDFMDATDNPFLFPQTPYSNITNGVGIFGAYSMKEKVIYADEF